MQQTPLQRWERIFWAGTRGMFLSLCSVVCAAKPLSVIIACIIMLGSAFEIFIAGIGLLCADKEEDVKEIHLYTPDEVNHLF
jgi:hypothetical protein